MWVMVKPIAVDNIFVNSFINALLFVNSFINALQKRMKFEEDTP